MTDGRGLEALGMVAVERSHIRALWRVERIGFRVKLGNLRGEAVVVVERRLKADSMKIVGCMTEMEDMREGDGKVRGELWYGTD